MDASYAKLAELAGQSGVARVFALRAELCRFAHLAPLSFLASRLLSPQMNILIAALAGKNVTRVKARGWCQPP